MFSLRSTLAQLPSDGATKWIRVENVKSPMSSVDVTRLFPNAVSWDFLSTVQRTNFLVTFENEYCARKAMRNVNGFMYKGDKLKFTYSEPREPSGKTPSTRITTAHPRLYLLPPEFSYEDRVAEADRIIASFRTKEVLKGVQKGHWLIFQRSEVLEGAMPSWDPKSYVSEAFSRILMKEARTMRNVNVPSYYDAVTAPLEAHELSESIRNSLENQRRRNMTVIYTLNDLPLEIMVNPTDAEGAGVTENLIKESVSEVICQFVRITDELNMANGKDGVVSISRDLYDVLRHVQAMGFLTDLRFNPILSIGKAFDSTADRLDTLKALLFRDEFQVEWPEELKINIGAYMGAWLVDRVATRLENFCLNVGYLVNFMGCARAFGTPEGNSMWKYGVCSCDVGSYQEFLGVVHLDVNRPSVAVQPTENQVLEPFGVQFCTVCCRTAATSHCLASAMSSFFDKDGALHFVREWREAHSPESKEALLSFNLYFRYEKPITDEDDVAVGARDTERILVHCKSEQIARAHKCMESIRRFSAHTESIVTSSRSADMFHNLSGCCDVQMAEKLERTMFSIPQVCVVASFVGSENVVGVSMLNAADILRDDDTFVFCISQRSPLFNHVFSKGSQVTLNFLFEKAQEVCRAMGDTYPLWIGKEGNESVFFECESRSYVTTQILKDVSDQVVFRTTGSFLVGEEALVVGKLIGSVPTRMVLNVENSLVLQHRVPPQEFYPFLFTTVHKIYGTVGFVGYGCQLCSLSPLTMYIYSPIESSHIALDEMYTGPKCTLTFLSIAGATVFVGKSIEELRCSLPVAASGVASLPQHKVYFQVDGMLIRIIRGFSDKYVICMIAASECRFNETDLCKLLVNGVDGSVTSL